MYTLLCAPLTFGMLRFDEFSDINHDGAISKSEFVAFVRRSANTLDQCQDVLRYFYQVSSILSVGVCKTVGRILLRSTGRGVQTFTLGCLYAMPRNVPTNHAFVFKTSTLTCVLLLHCAV